MAKNDYIMDVCVFWKVGCTKEEISGITGMSITDVNYVIDTYYEKLMRV